MAGWCRGYWSSQGREGIGFLWWASCKVREHRYFKNLISGGRKHSWDSSALPSSGGRAHSCECIDQSPREGKNSVALPYVTKGGVWLGKATKGGVCIEELQKLCGE